MGLKEYIIEQMLLIPSYVYMLVVGIFLIGCLLLICIGNINLFVRRVSALFIIGYVFLILGTTVIFRNVLEERQFHFVPFWSYAEKPYGHVLLLPETIVNINMFIPIGFLSCVILKRSDWRKVLLIGAGISFSIEILQILFQKGCSEFDDVFHNTLGCMIGYGMYQVVNRLWVKAIKAGIM